MKHLIISPSRLFIVGILIALNIILVYGQMRDDCIKDRSATGADCSTAPPSDCDEGMNKYKIEKGTASIYDNFGKLVKTIPNADFIVETDSKCGGNKEVSIYGDFGKTRNDGSYVIQGPQQECYRDYNCEWITTNGLSGYINEEVSGFHGTYVKSVYYSTWWQKQCNLDEEVTSVPITNWTWYDADWEDCHIVDAM
jgi:hypothetical protein